MQGLLKDLSPADLVAAMEENLSSFLPVFGELGAYYTDNPPGTKRSITDIPAALLNSVMDARLAPEDADAAIQDILADARSRKVPILWWTGPSTRPLDLGGRLKKFGFVHSDEAPGMAMELAHLKVAPTGPNGLSFQLAQDPDSWREWSSTMAAGFEIPASAAFVVEAWTRLLALTDPQTTFAYIARLDGRPVATSLLFLAGGVAGIYSVATIPEARRKGIGAQVTLYALQQARSRGYHLGVLQASDMGVSVYRSLGFQECCRINMYRWSP